MIIVTLYMLIFCEDQSYRELGGLSHYIICLGAAAFYFFSICDIIDGVRARRLKCGSPLGRIIDEGLDLIAYLGISNMGLWMIRPGPNYMVLLIGLVNLPFYCSELRHFVMNKLMMIVDELGPVEIEHIFSALVFFSGLSASNIYDSAPFASFGF
jgi:phosphatidylglycerophosphate synthase